MATLNYLAPTSISTAWDTETDNGYSGAKSFLVSLGDTNETTFTYFFPFSPVETSITDISREYGEIERPSNYSIVASKRPRLLKASFNFLVSDRDSHGLVSVDDELRFLAMIANRDNPVAFSGMGDFFSKIPDVVSGVNPYRLWRIVEMNIDVRRRNSSNEITQAQVSISVTEDRNPNVVFSTLPRITYQPYILKKKPPRKPPNTTDIANRGQDNPPPIGSVFDIPASVWEKINVDNSIAASGAGG